jgi:hypothetical protein
MSAADAMTLGWLTAYSASFGLAAVGAAYFSKRGRRK